MTLIVVGIFDDVYEGEIAASLLRSADIPTYLLGEQLAKYDAFQQRAWGGARLAVPSSCAEDARAVLALARSGALAETTDDVIPPPSERRAGWATASIAAVLMGSPDAA